MKRRILLAAIATILMAFAFVSCSGNVEAPEDRLGTISLGDNSRAVTTVVEYSSEVEDLVWFYKATKLDDGYTTGQTDGLVPVAAATKADGATSYTPTKGLSGKTLDGVFSYGLWKIELEGYKYETEEGGTQNVTVDESGTVAIAEGKSPEYTSTIDNHLVDKGATYATAKIEVGENAETKIVFDSVNGISFTSGNIKSTSSFTLAVKDSLSGSTIDVSTEDGDVAKADGSVTFKNITYTVPTGTDITGDHTMNFVLSQELKNTDEDNATANITIEAALYTLKFTVKKGTTTTISGTILKNDKTGTIQIDSFQDVEPITVSRALDVKDIGTTTDTAKVSTEKTITVGSMSVTYPEGALISTKTDGVTVEDKTEKTGTADAEQGIVRNDAAETDTITIGASESKETYELTLASSETATKENSALVKVEFFYGKNREVSTVYHNGVEIVKYTNQTEVETYSYDKDSGYMTLRVFHASPITIVTKQAVAEVNGTRYYSFAEAITGATDGNTITLLGNCIAGTNNEDGYLDINKNLTIDLANKTLDLEDGLVVMDDSKAITFKNGKITSKKGDEDPVFGDYVFVSTGDVKFQDVNFVQSGSACSIIYVPNGNLTIIDSEFSCNARESVICSYDKSNTVLISIENSKIVNSGTRGGVKTGAETTRTITPAAVSAIYGTLEISNSTIIGTGEEAEAVSAAMAEVEISNKSTIRSTSIALDIYYSTVKIENSSIATTKNESGSIAMKQEFGKVDISGESTVIDGYCALDIENGECKISNATITTSNTSSNNAILHVKNTDGYSSTLILNKVKSNPDSVKVYSEGASAKITSEVTNKKAAGGMTYSLNLANFSGCNS